jgi:hypothetical protein
MALRLSASSKNTRRLKRDRNAKFAAPPHWRGMVMVRQAREKQLEAETNSKGSSQATSIQLTSDQHQRKKSKLAHRSTMKHFDHTYNGGASLKTLWSMYLMKGQLILSRLGYDE